MGSMFDFAPRSATSHHAQDGPVLADDEAVRDGPAWSSLPGAHGEFAEGNDLVKRYRSDVSPFSGVASWEDPDVWDALIDVFGRGSEVFVSHADPELPEGWTHLSRGHGLQLIASDRLEGAPCYEAVELGADDVDEMLEPVGSNPPARFLPGTCPLGRYVGSRRYGRLVGMARVRLHSAGWTEISAVCLDADFRRQGLAAALTLDFPHAIRSRGDRPFLHA